MKIIDESFSISDLTQKLFGYINGRTLDKTKLILKENNIDPSIFDGKNKNKKYENVIKKCPVCEKEFETYKNKKEKTTCSHGCSNSYFKHGKNNPNFDEIKYKESYEKVSKSLKGRIYTYNEVVDMVGVKSIKIRKSKEVVEKDKRFCIVCNIEITNKPKIRIYCSNKCRASVPTSEETKKKLSDKMKDNFKNGKLKGWQSRNIESYPEKFFKQVLLNNNIEFEFNKPVRKRDLGIDCGCNYFLDFYIKNGNIDLEIDGKQHKYRIGGDKLRDDALIKGGYDVYRIKWKLINSESGKKYIKNEIEKFIEYYKQKNRDI